jgi:hypothetical protein
VKHLQRTLSSQYQLAEKCLVKHGIRGADAALAEFKRRISARYKRAVRGDRESYMDDAVFHLLRGEGRAGREPFRELREDHRDR